MYIGTRKIKSVAGDSHVIVEYEDGLFDHFSKLMYDKIVSNEPCDATALREKRIYPVVEEVLRVLRDWGMKLNELPYMSAILNESLKQNENAALKELWLKWIPTLSSIDDV